MLPDRCSVTENGNQCVNPPEFIVSITNDAGQYMICVTCSIHKDIVAAKVILLQDEGRISSGKVSFEKIKPVGTDCIRCDPDLVQINDL